MKKNIICIIAIASMFGAASVNSNQISEWEKYSDRNIVSTTYIESANLIERPEWENFLAIAR